MHVLHIANTFFEEELSKDCCQPLLTRIESTSIYLQLQYVPFLYAPSSDYVWTSTPPPDFFLEHLKALGFSPPQAYAGAPCDMIESWGASLCISSFAKEKGIPYFMPPWSVVHTVNSKEFSFLQAPKLKGAALLCTAKELSSWLSKTSGPRVLKTSLGVSGKGHFFVHEGGDPYLFAQKEWLKGRPVIGEPWVERVFDFSTQWYLAKTGEISYLGATLCENSAQGTYLSNAVGIPIEKNHLETHLQIARPILEHISQLGYFGNLGIDAMVYKDRGREVLHPLVEINARKTMGWLALTLHKKLSCDSLLLRFSPYVKNPLLPQEISLSNGRKFTFKRQLQIVINPSIR